MIPPHGSSFSSIQQTNLQVQTSNDGNDTQIEIFNLHPHPDLDAPHSHTTVPPPRTSKAHDEDFPAFGSGIVSEVSTSVASSGRAEEMTYPGFTLLQTATAQYCLRRYSQALDTTTDCLALQKTFFSHEGSGGRSTTASVKGSTNSTEESIPATVQNGFNALTPFDSRSSFAAQIGSSVLGVVRSLKTDNPNKEQLAAKHQHPMLSNTISAMISQYPSKPCVAKTLLLRGHILAACARGPHEYDDDRSLIVQATKNVEMAVAIQRKLPIGNDLAVSLILLGTLKTRLGLHHEAESVYKEAESILRVLRSSAKRYQLDSSKDGCSEKSISLIKVTHEIGHTLYLHGKSFHCRRMYAQAFHFYNRALCLLKRSDSSLNNAGMKNIVRCMKKHCALEKLVSAYWDDAGVI